ncbi:MAG: transglycosylase SLT domain-containing protein [Pseudomonadales bacterium]|nr:transglycosylase SLT domain-containing protein [Pseudomonadales bacterium]
MPVRLFYLLLSLCFSASVLAANAGYSFSDNKPIDSSRFEQRQLYKELIYLIKTNQQTKYRAREKQLQNYPLYPYLEYTNKIQRISRQSEADIIAFAEQYRDTPLSSRLIQRYLYSLASQGHWKKFINHYDQTIASRKNTCHYAFALAKTDQLEQAMALASQLWLVEYSQPDACDPIFKRWRDAGQLTTEMAWQRYNLAINNNEITLANYISRFLSKADRNLANNLKQLRRKPNNITHTNRFKNTDEKTQSVILYGLKRLARKDPATAIDTLNKYLITHTFNKSMLTDTSLYIAKKLASRVETAHLVKQINLDLSGDQKLVETQIRSSLRQLDWHEATKHINQLAEHTRLTDRWQYWQARSAMTSTDLDRQQTAAQTYQRLAKKRSFYGFMAADYLGLAYNFEDENFTPPREEILDLQATPGIQRALEFYALEQRTNARREWNFTAKDFSSREYRIAASVAKNWGWHEQAIQATISAQAWNDLDIRFPLAFYDDFVGSARKADIPVDWSLAVARQESAFMPDAKSSAGALGIMQLLLSTAKSTAGKAKLANPSKRSLTRPEINIRLGTAYLGRMLRRFDNNRALASAAYNAGPTRVSTWQDDTLPIDVWVETIPFKETRSYVINVLVFSAIYSRKLNQHSPFLYDHERILLPTYSPPDIVPSLNIPGTNNS